MPYLVEIFNLCAQQNFEQIVSSVWASVMVHVHKDIPYIFEYKSILNIRRGWNSRQKLGIISDSNISESTDVC